MEKADLLKSVSERIAGRDGGKAYTEMYAELAQVQQDPAQLAEQLRWIIENAQIDLQSNGESVDTSSKRFFLGSKIRRCTELLTLVELILAWDK